MIGVGYLKSLVTWQTYRDGEERDARVSSRSGTVVLLPDIWKVSQSGMVYGGPLGGLVVMPIWAECSQYVINRRKKSLLRSKDRCSRDSRSFSRLRPRKLISESINTLKQPD